MTGSCKGSIKRPGHLIGVGRLIRVLGMSFYHRVNCLVSVESRQDIITSTARASSVFPSRYRNTIFNQSASVCNFATVLGLDPVFLKVVQNTFQRFTNILMFLCNHSLSVDAKIMVSKNCPIIGEHVVIFFEPQ